MATRLIFIHGRNQQGKDPGELRRAWYDAMVAGFETVGLDTPIDEADVIFPFFGDALFELTRDDESLDDAAEVLGDDAAAAEADGTPSEEVQFGREVLEEVLDGAGVSSTAIDAEINADADRDSDAPTDNTATTATTATPATTSVSDGAANDGTAIDTAATDGADAVPTEADKPTKTSRRERRRGGILTWEWVHTGLSIIDRYLPGASGASVAYAANDVAQYLKNDDVRAEIHSVVGEAFAGCEAGDTLVVVGHSLGSVIAYNLLASGELDCRADVAVFVTLGSPLGLKAIRDAVGPVTHPPRVAHWVNAYDQRDVVALYPLDRKHFDIHPPVLNHGAVDNRSDNHHKIGGYLSDPVVALTIHRALTTGELAPALRRRRRTQGEPGSVHELRTPALVVESSVFDANCAAMDAVLPGTRLRPHVKAFKSTALAKRLAADGHTAFCAATPLEIEGLVAAGLGDDLLLANESLDVARLGALVAADAANISVAVDSDATLDAAIIGGVRSVLIDVNVGLPRCGCAVDDAARLAERARRAGLEVRGVMGYEGHLMMIADRTERAERVQAAMAQLLAAHGEVGGDIISGGGTGTFDTNTWCTEIQAGSYCLMDTHYDSLDLPFFIALNIVATVISVSPKGWIVADAGLKAHGMDHGNPNWVHGDVLFCSDEHVTLRPHDPTQWSVGDLVYLQPAHVDPTVAKHTDLWLVDGRRILDRWPVDLRHW